MNDEDLLPLSALQHLAFCERQCALIHVDREWEENQRTAEGQTLHKSVDEGYREFRQGLKQFAGVYVRSLKLGIFGKLDMLEVAKTTKSSGNLRFLNLQGNWSMLPVEFKRGKPKSHDADRIQVCAQAICLEEMADIVIDKGALFYGEIRRRETVELGPELRAKTVSMAARLHELVSRSALPPPVLKRHCRACSLREICQPGIVNGQVTEAYRRELFG